MRSKDGFAPAGDVINSSLKKMGLDKKTREYRAIILWPEIVGKQIANATKVERARDGVLRVTCKTSAWANELTMLRAEILKKIDERVGNGVITELHFSGRGFKQDANEKEEQNEAENIFEVGTPALEEIEEAEKIASTVEDDKLAEQIKKTLLIARRRSQQNPGAGGSSEA